jgi:hypothetical protein
MPALAVAIILKESKRGNVSKFMGDYIKNISLRVNLKNFR